MHKVSDTPNKAAMTAPPPFGPGVEPHIAERLQQIAWWDWNTEQIDAALADFRSLNADEFAEKYGR